ncbi:hypothetical protein ACTA71_004794 [Dictyostelium dimigraforme]
MDQFKVPPPTYAPIAGQPIYGQYNNYMGPSQVSSAMLYSTPMMTPPMMTPPTMIPPMMTPPIITPPIITSIGYPPMIRSQPFMGPPPSIPSQPFMGPPPSMVSPGFGITPNLNVPFSTNVKYYD